MSVQELEQRLSAIPEDAECPISLIREYKDAIKKVGGVRESDVPIFSERYPTILKMILEVNDLKMLDLFLDQLATVQSGNSELKAVESDLAKVLNNKYVIPKITKR